MTARAAVIGWPITHSKSPAMLNAAFAAAGIDARMDPIGVPPEGFAAAVAELRALPMLGASVTLPHKLAAHALCDELSADARAIGAVNCLALDGARLVGHNTDAPGFTAALAAAGFAARGAHAVLLGAGGAARAVAHGLATAGASVEVIARAPHDVAWTAAQAWSTAALRTAFSRAQLVVDCTPAGLDEATDENFTSQLPLGVLPPAAWVASLVYHRRTALLARALGGGHAVLDGCAMLVHQGARAFTIWTGRTAPIDVMTRALDASL